MPCMELNTDSDKNLVDDNFFSAIAEEFQQGHGA